jgi:hypothetical protein
MSIRIAPRLLAVLGLAVLLSLLLAAPAAAEPVLDLQMTRTEQPTHVGDERLLYKLNVSNEASPNAGVGTTLTCRGTPPEVGWQGNPVPEFTFEWLRDGEVIGGETEPTYTTTALDAGKSVQCVVSGTNDPDEALTEGGLYDDLSASVASLPPTVIEPAPASAPPSGETRPPLPGPPGIAATPSGTATTEAGSKLLTDVVTAEGSGTFTNGSQVVEGVTMSSGFFEGFQAVSGTCVPAETTIFKVEETASEVFKVTLTKPATCTGPGTLEAGAQPFGVGHEISGECIPAGAKILKATNQGLGQFLRGIEMDLAATCSKADAAIEATSTLNCAPPSGWSAGTPIEWSFRWLRNGEEIAGETDPTYEVREEDTDPPSVLQCRTSAEDEEGQKAVAYSESKATRPFPPAPYNSPGTSGITIDFANQTSGPVALELRAPDGPGVSIFAAKGTGWDCTKTLADQPEPTASCTRSDTLAPQGSYQTAEFAVALGQDPPLPLLTEAEVSGGNAPVAASAEDQIATLEPRIPFGFKAFETRVKDDEGNDYDRAGGHPFSAGASIDLNTHVRAEGGVLAVNGSPKEIRTEAPPGFVGNPQALPELCTEPGEFLNETCPPGSAVGEILVSSTAAGAPSAVPIYALEPEFGQPAQFAFQITKFIFTLNPELRPEDGYAIDLVTQPLPKSPEVFGSVVTLCGFGVKLSGPTPEGCRKADEAEAFERPFITLPTKCGDPASATTRILADSWEGDFAEAEHTLTPPVGCEELEFSPDIEARPTTNRADSPTGLEFNLHIPQNEDPEGTATSHLKKTVITLPEGLLVNPSGANGLGACSEAQVGMKDGVPDDEPVLCPDASKIGAVSVTTPILDHPLPGTLYLASPHQNPFDSLIALYLVVESPEDGITIKLAGKTEADPSTGRLTTTFDRNPQAPVEDVELDIPGGALAPLRTPESCGKYTATSSLTPWSAPQSGPPVTPSDSFQINRSPTGGACASSLPNTPSFEAGVASAIAGAHSPFVVKLRREDGTQQFSEVTVTPPPGLVAKLAGTSPCSDSSLAQAQTKSGKQEQSSPSCPPSSELGNVIAAAGAGPSPFHAQGKAYLAGPYKGAPLSIAIVTPAVAGPFDLGVVVVRAAAHVDPATAEITVTSDPLPTILEGIPLDIRSATVSIDRPDFTLNPTSCDPTAVKGNLISTLGQSATLKSRFQLAECGRLAFKPELKLKLSGKTRRGAYQGLKATLSAKPGQANIASASVRMPRSAFLAQEHIRTICTRVRFQADSCPKGSIYGRAKAITPLLEEPLEGPVYLRSSDNKLPDLLIALKGPDSLPIEIELAGRTDSKKGALRNTFDLVPDAPVSKFTLELFGARKGLIVNSRDLCSGTQRATVEMSAHNGKTRSFRPVVGNGCSRKAGKRRR